MQMCRAKFLRGHCLLPGPFEYLVTLQLSVKTIPRATETPPKHGTFLPRCSMFIMACHVAGIQAAGGNIWQEKGRSFRWNLTAFEGFPGHIYVAMHNIVLTIKIRTLIVFL